MTLILVKILDASQMNTGRTKACNKKKDFPIFKAEECQYIK